MNKHRLVKEFCNLVSIDAPSFHERKIANVLKKYLEELGFDVYEDHANEIYNSECGNIYGYLEGTMEGAPILFSAHMDTVEPSRGKKAIIEEGGRIVSDHSTVLGADDVSGIVAILEAIRGLKEDKKEHRSIEVLFCIAEEPYLRGSEVFDYSRIKAKEAYVLDLSGPVGGIAYLAPTVLMLTAQIEGKASHAGFAPEKGINAIAIASQAISKLQLGRLDEETTANIGLIEGGLATNIIPEKCTVKGEIRSCNHEKAVAQAEFMKQKFIDTAEEMNGKCEASIFQGSVAYEVPTNHAVIQRFNKACNELGIDIELQKTFGGSDNNNFMLHGITGCVIACGMNAVHSTSEYSSVDELVRITQITEKLMTSRE
ncbi:M20/M25/M40 family metallo-hydrolase [Anaeromicropila herbilytica]|uniref:Peptidase M20 n=1 Tax=Anaeromicropila herbilytica TaxID=2785025 RepID=A0A7R7EKH4_9FIRM|nr:M20/M25/M40 family metallo-hydrolase [Anaeromicropila herbilytica]BCN30432.1 peptidase M20 [Anaeromicropila herbilytica]